MQYPWAIFKCPLLERKRAYDLREPGGQWMVGPDLTGILLDLPKMTATARDLTSYQA